MTHVINMIDIINIINVMYMVNLIHSSAGRRMPHMEVLELSW